MSAPAIPEDMKNVPKKQLDVVLASGPEGKVFAIPVSIAAEYESDDKHLAVFPPDGESEEVGGRHAAFNPGGPPRYHEDWQIGRYIWICDGGCYYGPHWHPNRYSFYAHDEDG